MVWSFRVLLRHVGSECGSFRSAGRWLLHRSPILHRTPCRAAAYNHTGLHAVSYSGRLLNRAVEATDRPDSSQKWADFLYCPSRLRDRKEGPRSVRLAAEISRAAETRRKTVARETGPSSALVAAATGHDADARRPNLEHSWVRDRTGSGCLRLP